MQRPASAYARIETKRGQREPTARLREHREPAFDDPVAPAVDDLGVRRILAEAVGDGAVGVEVRELRFEELRRPVDAQHAYKLRLDVDGLRRHFHFEKDIARGSCRCR